MIDFENLYTTPLLPGKPDQGMGFYCKSTGRLRFYSSGDEWYFEAKTGRPVFRIVDEQIIDERDAGAPAARPARYQNVTDE